MSVEPIKTTYHENGQVEYEEWWVDGRRHRLDGPAGIEYYENGQVKCEEWWVDGRRHRLPGPALIDYYDDGQVECEQWWVDGHRHRLDGPARIVYYENGQVACEEWWVNGQQYTQEAFQQRRLDYAPVLAHVNNWAKIVELANQYYFICEEEFELTDLTTGIQRLEALGKVQFEDSMMV